MVAPKGERGRALRRLAGPPGQHTIAQPPPPCAAWRGERYRCEVSLVDPRIDLVEIQPANTLLREVPDTWKEESGLRGVAILPRPKCA